MTSTKSGFSTLNRLLGKRSKADLPVNPHATMYSRGSSNSSSSGTPSSTFTKSMSNLDTSSQYNKIVPLAAMSNAPFEQTFRVTIALPRDQLFVVRVGAKTQLQQILETTCTAKQLDSSKYEFRHPADNSMVFANTQTIGEVGLNEIRLASIFENRSVDNNFSNADIARMKAGNRNSYAAPSFTNASSRDGLGTGKSFYSSMNSLNSLDSSGQVRPVVPMRKKRSAPRPPSQNVILEDPSLRTKSFHVSTPNLTQNHLSLPAQNLLPPPEAVGAQANFGGSAMDLDRSRTSSNASDSVPKSAPRRKKVAPVPPPRLKENVVPAPRTITPVPQKTQEEEPSERIPEPSEGLYEEIGLPKTFVRPEVESIKLVTPTDLPGKAVAEEDKSGYQMNIYNLTSGKCVEAEIVPGSTEELDLEVIQGMITDQFSGLDEDVVVVAEKLDAETAMIQDKRHIVEDLYAEVKKPEKKLQEIKTMEETDPETDPRSDSPQWTYTLPAPVKFSDGNNNNVLAAVSKNGNGTDLECKSPETEVLPKPEMAPMETYNETMYYNYSEVDDVDPEAALSINTTTVSDALIRPVIKERIPLPLGDDNQSHNNSESSDFNSSSTMTPNGLHLGDEDTEANDSDRKLIINSDIEDGYHGKEAEFVNQGLLATLEKRREMSMMGKLDQLEQVNTERLNLLPTDQTIIPEEMIEKSHLSVDNQEPKISTSPIEDGLPSSLAQRQYLDEDSSYGGSKDQSLELSMSGSGPDSSFDERGSDMEYRKNHINREESSDLSISDSSSSSLQSIQVMRNIMSANEKRTIEEEVSEEEEVHNKRPATPPPSPEVQRSTVTQSTTKPWSPPKINVGSWSERPRVQVSLKTDSDYHHSLQKSAGLDKTRDERVPFVRAIELKKTVSVPEETPVQIRQQQPNYASAEKVPQPTPLSYQRPHSLYSTSFTPTVRGFLNSQKGREVGIRSTVINPVLLRSDSNVVAKANGAIAVRGESLVKSTSANNTTEAPAPFSQMTLRRTGFKERIVAPNDEETKEQIKVVLKPVQIETSIKTAVEVVSSPVSPTPPPPPPPPKTAPGEFLNPLAQKEDSLAVPTKPIVRGVVAKKLPIIQEVDPRAQLLDSIKNFRLNSLKKK